MAVMIGVDPHKGSHTAVAIDGDEVELASVTVRATRRQVDELLGWAARFEDPDLGDRVGGRPRVSAWPTARRGG
jgi:hypothetical protein